MYTWKHIKEEALQLMFAGESEAQDYLPGMPQAANFALCDLACTCAPILCEVTAVQFAPQNLLEEGCEALRLHEGEMAVKASAARAFGIEISGEDVSLVVEDADGVPLYRAQVRSADGFERHAAVLQTAQAITIRTSAEKPYYTRNISAVREAAVPQAGGTCAYDVKELAALCPGALAFSRMAEQDAVWYNGAPVAPMVQYDGAHIVRVPAHWQGELRFCYYGLPTAIAEDTPEDFVPELPEECLRLVPLYIASRLYAEDDLSQAVTYWNLYDAKRSELSSVYQSGLRTPQAWRAESGWV